MTAKMYKKKDLTVIEGRLVASDGTVVNIDPLVVDQINCLETRYQKAMWLNGQPAACEGPNFDEFKRIHASEATKHAFAIDTPKLDKAVEESLELMHDLDRQASVDMLNKELEDFSALINWCASENVFSDDWSIKVSVDAPMILADYNDILHLTTDDIMRIFIDIYGEALGVQEDDEEDVESEQG